LGILLEKARKKITISYILSGITADVAQLERAHIKSNSKGQKRNVTQIIKKLEKYRKSL